MALIHNLVDWAPLGLPAFLFVITVVVFFHELGHFSVARACGGLHEIIQDFDPGAGVGNGFLFYDYSSEALWDAIMRARKLFADRPAWERLMERAMSADFSWENTAARYEKVYAHLAAKPKPSKFAGPGFPR